MLTYLVDAIFFAGLSLILLAIVGVVRLPDVYLKLHAAGKATSVGLGAIAIATFAEGEAWVSLTAVLAAAVLLVTSPVSAHAIARAALIHEEPMHHPDSVDESEGKLGSRLRSEG